MHGPMHAAAACHTKHLGAPTTGKPTLDCQKQSPWGSLSHSKLTKPCPHSMHPCLSLLSQPKRTCAALDAKLSEHSVSAPLPGSGEMLHTSSTLDEPHSESWSTCRNTTAAGWWCLLQLFGAPHGRIQPLPKWARIYRLKTESGSPRWGWVYWYVALEGQGLMLSS